MAYNFLQELRCDITLVIFSSEDKGVFIHLILFMQDINLLTRRLKKGNQPLPHTTGKTLPPQFIICVNYLVNWGLFRPWHCQETASDFLNTTTFLRLFLIWKTIYSSFTNLTQAYLHCYLQIDPFWMGLAPTKFSKLPYNRYFINGPRDYYSVDVLAASSQVFWNLWTIHDIHKLSMNFWCQKLPSLALCYALLKQQLLTTTLGSPRNRDYHKPWTCDTLYSAAYCLA